MTSRDFCFWLQGLFELGEVSMLNEKQTDLIKRHLAMVFIHEIDPSMSDDPEVQQQLQDIHDGPQVIDGPGVPPEEDDLEELKKKLQNIHDGVEELKQRKSEPGPPGPRGPAGRSRGDTRYTC